MGAGKVSVGDREIRTPKAAKDGHSSRVKQAKAWLFKLNFKPWKYEVLTVTMVRAGAAVTRVLNQKRMSGEGEQDKTRVRGHVHSMDAPGGGPKPTSE